MLSRSGWTLLMLAGLSIGLLAPDATNTVAKVSGSSFPEALVALGCLVQLALAGWVVLTVALRLAHAPTPLLRAVAPRLLRQALFAGTAGALVVLSPVHAQADRTAPHRPATHDIVGLRLPDRPIVVRNVQPQPASVVVKPGDTLWAIAARTLPVDATDADIAVACARWYDTNRAVIGADPHLIFPQQRLVQPLGKDPT